MKLATFIFHSSNRMTAWNQIEAHDIILNCACVVTSSFFHGLALYEDKRSYVHQKIRELRIIC